MAKSRYKAVTDLKTYEVAIYGDIHNITNCFCKKKKVLKSDTLAYGVTCISYHFPCCYQYIYSESDISGSTQVKVHM